MKKYLLTAGRMVIGLLIVALSYGQEQQMAVFGTAEGLSDSNIADVHRDRLGYLWVATSHGLNRYDGLDFRIFRYDPEDTNSIRANSLDFLYEDPQSNIWATLSIGGVSKYNRKEDRFQHFTHDPENGSNPNNFVTDVLVDSRNQTWIGTNNRINKVYEVCGLFQPVIVEGVDDLQVYRIFEDSKQNIWLGTDKGLFRLDPESESFKEVLDTEGKKLDDVFRFLEDGDRNLWFSSYDYVYKLQADIPEKIERPHGRFITSLFTTKNGNVYISQYDDHIYEWTDEKWSKLKDHTAHVNGLRYGYAKAGMSRIMIEDTEGQLFIHDLDAQTTQPITTPEQEFKSFWIGPDSDELWLGTRELGLFKVDLSPQYLGKKQLNPLNTEFRYANHVSAITNLADNGLIVASGGALHQYWPHIGKSERLSSRHINALTKEGVSAIKALNDQDVLVANGKGLFELNLKTKKTIKQDYFPEGRTFDFLIEQDSLWAIGQYGLAVHDLKSGKEVLFKNLDSIPPILGSPNVRALYKDKQGTIWIGTVRDGLFKINFAQNTQRFEVENFRYAGARTGVFKSQTINHIREDEAGRLWTAGFSSGLMEFDRTEKRFINHNPEGELPIPNIQTLELADDGSIWMSALNGIHRYDPETKAFRQFSVQDGLLTDSFVLRTSAKTSAGRLFFGTGEGLVFLSPADFKPEISDRKVLIEELRVNTDGTSLRLPDTAIGHELTHKQSFVSFDFISIDYRTPEKTSYQYQLEGLEEQWHSGKSRQVQYANLEPGVYTFKVRAGTDGGNWDENYTSLSFTIASPYWQQTWFQALVVISLLSLIYGFYRFRLNVKLSKARVLENIRQSAAADFHDEMGNKLTRIALFSEVLEQKLNGTSPEISSYVSKIKDNSHVLNNSMRDFLWALDPAKDTAFDLIMLLKDFGDELFDNSGVNFHGASIKEAFREYPLDMDWKRHLVMIFKEAMHNALKYSMAKNVTLKATLSSDVLNLSLTDDGQGFDPQEIDNGYGQANMKRRADHLGASISIESEPGLGTMVTFIGTLTKKHETYD
ncbi:MAG: hypothetical protein HEP71_29500 [Roseivirga sp.]|nr:hypothetical protein [Roseivirga sp.]